MAVRYGWMIVTFVLGLGFLLLLILLPGILLVGENPKAKRLLVTAVVGFFILVLALVVIAERCETIGLCT